MVGSSASYVDKIQRYYPFTFLELRNIVITILIIGFMYGYNDGSKEFHWVSYSSNMLVCMAITTITMLVFLTGQRLAGLSAGYRVEFQMWWPGLIVALIITFIVSSLTNYPFWIPIAGGMVIHHMAAHRLGFFRYGLNMLDNGIIASCGPLANIVFATIIQQMHLLMGLFNATMVARIYWFNLTFALVNMLPIPPLPGSKLIYNSRLPYIFIFSFMVVYTIMAAFEFYSWILSLIGAFILWLWYYVKVETSK